MPKVSVIVPTYNCANYLGELCRSIQAQTFKDFEVIVLDDGSSDNTGEVMEEFLRDPRFQLLRWEKNRGNNRGHFTLLTRVSSEYWCVPGADDVLHPSFLEARVRMMDAHAHAAFAHGPAHWMDETGQPLPCPHGPLDLPQEIEGSRMLRILLQHNIIITSSLLARTSVTKLVLPYYATNFRYCNDWLLWFLHASTGFDILWDDQPRVNYRHHAQSLTKSPQHTATRLAEVRLVPLCALSFARQYSMEAQSLFSRCGSALYAAFLQRAIRMFFAGTLKQGWFEKAAFAFYGSTRARGFFVELLRHLPAIVKHQILERKARLHQRFEVAGLASIDEALFRK